MWTLFVTFPASLPQGKSEGMSQVTLACPHPLSSCTLCYAFLPWALLHSHTHICIPASSPPTSAHPVPGLPHPGDSGSNYHYNSRTTCICNSFLLQSRGFLNETTTRTTKAVLTLPKVAYGWSFHHRKPRLFQLPSFCLKTQCKYLVCGSLNKTCIKKGTSRIKISIVILLRTVWNNATAHKF